MLDISVIGCHFVRAVVLFKDRTILDCFLSLGCYERYMDLDRFLEKMGTGCLARFMYAVIRDTDLSLEHVQLELHSCI